MATTVKQDAAFLKSRGSNINPGTSDAFIRRAATILRDAEKATGKTASINNVYRTNEYQAQLRANKTRRNVVYNGVTYKPGLQRLKYAAKPGQSRHNFGQAMDLNSGAIRDWVRKHANEYGLETIPGDTPHIQMVRGPAGEYAFAGQVIKSLGYESVADFQDAAGISSDNVVGPDTMAALATKLGDPATQVAGGVPDKGGLLDPEYIAAAQQVALAKAGVDAVAKKKAMTTVASSKGTPATGIVGRGTVASASSRRPEMLTAPDSRTVVPRAGGSSNAGVGASAAGRATLDMTNAARGNLSVAASGGTRVGASGTGAARSTTPFRAMGSGSVGAGGSAAVRLSPGSLIKTSPTTSMPIRATGSAGVGSGTGTTFRATGSAGVGSGPGGPTNVYSQAAVRLTTPARSFYQPVMGQGKDEPVQTLAAFADPAYVAARIQVQNNNAAIKAKQEEIAAQPMNLLPQIPPAAVPQIPPAAILQQRAATGQSAVAARRTYAAANPYTAGGRVAPNNPRNLATYGVRDSSGTVRGSTSTGGHYTSSGGGQTVTTRTGTYERNKSGRGYSKRKVLCTYFKDKGWLPRDIWLADGREYKMRPGSRSEIMRVGYHWWAVPTVRYLERQTVPAKALERVLWPLIKAWSYEAAYRTGKLPTGTLRGKMARLILEPSAYLIGLMVTRARRRQPA